MAEKKLSGRRLQRLQERQSWVYLPGQKGEKPFSSSQINGFFEQRRDAMEEAKKAEEARKEAEQNPFINPDSVAGAIKNDK